MTNILIELGRHLGFEVGSEIEAGESAWVDVVWFDKRFDYGPTKREKWSRVKARRQPVLPVAAFEIEGSAGSKPLKGSIANFNELGAALNVIVLTEENIPKLKKRGHQQEPDSKTWEWLVGRANQWIYESRPASRVVVMKESEVKDWAKVAGLTLPSESPS